MKVKQIINPVHNNAPIQSIPSKGIYIGVRTALTKIRTMSIMSASIPIIIQCIYSHCEKNEA